MKNKLVSSKKKLSLSKETVRSLSEQDLALVAGATSVCDTSNCGSNSPTAACTGGCYTESAC